MSDNLNELEIYTDGASRGNPGPASAAFIIRDRRGNTIRKGSMFLGKTTNNRAEYRAVIKALETAKELSNAVKVNSDSNLLVRQLRGEWKVKNDEIKSLYKKVKDLEKEFKEIEYIHRNRENEGISKADDLCNQRLDEAA